jgi:hypothetical protein
LKVEWISPLPRKIMELGIYGIDLGTVESNPRK